MRCAPTARHLWITCVPVVSDMQSQLELFATEEDLENASLYEPSNFVGVVFTDSSATSYKLRFPYNQLPSPSHYIESFGKASLFLLHSLPVPRVPVHTTTIPSRKFRCAAWQAPVML